MLAASRLTSLEASRSCTASSSKLHGGFTSSRIIQYTPWSRYVVFSAGFEEKGAAAAD
jgi:hypothetical protein